MAFTFPFRDFLKDLEPYVPGEQLDGPQVIKLNTNESPWPPSENVCQQVAQEAEKLHLYPSPAGDTLRRALAAYHGIAPEQVILCNGSDEALRLLIHAFMEPGKSIGMVTPSYSLYPVLAATYQAETRAYPLEEMEILTEEAKTGAEPLFFLPNPNPPLGTFYDRAEVADLCRKRSQSLVVIDEAYVDFAPRDMVSLLHEFPNMAITRTFSKSFSLAGARIGYLLGRPELVEGLMKLRDSYNVDRLAQAAAAAALADVDGMLQRRGKILEVRQRVTETLRALGFRVPDSHGNFVFAMHPRAREYYQKLREQGILVRYFDQTGLQGGMRVTIGSPEQMARFLEAIKTIVAA